MLKARLKSVIALLLSFLPTPLPNSLSTFETWSDEVISLAGVPNNDSFKHALASNLQRVPDRVTHMPKRFFVQTLRRAVINEYAYHIIQNLVKKAREQQSVQDQTVSEVKREMV